MRVDSITQPEHAANRPERARRWQIRGC
jgi:hypothetical protein